MKRFRIYILILTLTLTQSCLPPSKDQIQKIETPDKALLSDFGIELSGEIIYQFYQKYGFTDLEEQLILVMKPRGFDLKMSDQPLNSPEIKSLQKTSIRKFTDNQPIDFTHEKFQQADIRLESKEYDSGQSKSVHFNNRTYRIIQTDSTETIYVLDHQTQLMYVESIK